MRQAEHAFASKSGQTEGPYKDEHTNTQTELGVRLGGRRDAAQLVDGRARLDRIDRAVRVHDVHRILHENQRRKNLPQKSVSNPFAGSWNE